MRLVMRSLPNTTVPACCSSSLISAARTDDAGRGIVYDPVGAGGVWVTGFTDSTNFPLVNPLRSQLSGQIKNAQSIPPVDAFICKLDPSGTSLLFSTYFGGDGIDEGLGIANDANGGIYVTGLTSSTNLPVTPSDAYQTSSWASSMVLSLNCPAPAAFTPTPTLLITAARMMIML